MDGPVLVVPEKIKTDPERRDEKAFSLRAKCCHGPLRNNKWDVMDADNFASKGGVGITSNLPIADLSTHIILQKMLTAPATAEVAWRAAALRQILSGKAIKADAEAGGVFRLVD